MLQLCFFSVDILRKPLSLVPVQRGEDRVNRVAGRCPSRLASNLEAYLSRASKQRLRRQVCVRVRPPQVCGTARGLDGNLIRGRGLQPRRRVRGWTEAPCIHWGVVEILPATCPMAFHCPALEETTKAVRHSDEPEISKQGNPVNREGLRSHN